MRQPPKRRSRAQEVGIARRYGGRPTPASGATWAAKADVRTSEYMIEAKYTDKKTYRLDRNYLKRLFDNAMAEGKTGAMIVDLDGLSLVIIAEADWHA